MIYFKFLKNYIFFEIFYKKCNKIIHVLFLLWFIFFILGLFFCLFYTPEDYQQNYIFKIIYVHVPSAFLSLFIYVIMGFCSFFYLIRNIQLADFFAKESAKVGILFTFLALFSGSIWAKPTWGTWWVWDARLTSELVLLFLYIGYSGLRFAIKNTVVASKCCAILNLVGLINVPVIHYSVKWWYTLHQGYTLRGFLSNSILTEMFYPLFFVLFTSIIFYICVVCYSVCTHILDYEKEKNWVYKEVFFLHENKKF